jgi:tRNA (cmo5U34)-methyltransferase
MKKDRLFAKKKEEIKPFEFNMEVADIFDDMLNRSVPLYLENIERQAQFTALYYKDKSRIYDLGCSHGNLGIRIAQQLKSKIFTMIGVDNSRPMIEKYFNRLKKFNHTGQIDLVCGFLEDIQIKNASVVLINLTMQFIDKKKRNLLIKNIYNGLNPGGILLLTEKIIHSSKAIDTIQKQFYKKFKLENGYSLLEISQKRDALDKVLIPDTLEIHEKRILHAGFKHFEVWLKWFNFASMIAIKKQ